MGWCFFSWLSFNGWPLLDLDSTPFRLITSKIDLGAKVGDYYIQEWKKANLPKPSMIRMKFATIDKKIIVKQFGKLCSKDIAHFSKKLSEFFSK